MVSKAVSSIRTHESWVWLPGAIVFLLLSVAGRARADPFHQQTLPLGQRAIGMGGAFTAVADDPSATYYNPAGLVLTDDSSLSASLTLQAFDKTTVKGGYRTRVGSASLGNSVGTSLPVFVSAIKLLGKRDSDGRRRHAIGISTFTVSQRRLSFDVEKRGSGATGPALETLQVSDSDRTVWYAISYAYRVNRRFSLGLSSFLSVLRSSYSDQSISANLGAVNMDGTFQSSGNSYFAHSMSTNVKSLLGRVGALYAVNSKLQLGLMLQTPSVHLRGKASIRERTLSTDTAMMEPAIGSVSNEHQKNLDSRNPVPWEVRLGTRYELYEWLTLALDTALYGPTGSKKHPVVVVGKRKIDPETNSAPGVGPFAMDSYWRDWNGNVSLGLSARLPRTVTVRAGLYTDLSSAPRVPRSSSTYYAPDVNRFGGTLAIGLQNEGFDISLGAIGVIGRGHALAFNTDSGPGDVYQRTVATDRMFLFFLNGVKSAISTLAKHAEKGLMNIKKRLDERGEEEPEPQPEPQRGPSIAPSP
ncbi:MAG: hypothetical protein JWN48_2722 [Myxococcaceae bacterium]|nr:hypothetical protein [Myxococcaceae bacterium]